MTTKIPEGWREASLGTLIQEKFYKIKNNLRQPLSSSQRVKMQGSYPYYGAAGQIDSVDDYKFEGHHLLMAEDGTVTKDGIHPMLQLVDGKFWVSNHAHVLQGSTKQDTLLLYYMLYNVNISKYITGAVQPKLSKRNLLNIKILCPPISKQKVIASLLEKWDTATEKTETLIASKLKRFKWLVKTLIKQKQYINGWQEVKLGDIAEINNGKSNSQDANPTGIYPLFDRSMLTKKSDRYLFDKEAVIIPGEGKEFVAKYYYGKFDLHQRCYAIHSFNKNIFPRFCYYYLMSSGNYFRSVAVGSTVSSLRLGHFQRLLVILPSFSEQKAIVQILDTAQREIFLLKQLAERYQVQKRGLMNKLLTGEWRIST